MINGDIVKHCFCYTLQRPKRKHAHCSHSVFSGPLVMKMKCREGGIRREMVDSDKGMLTGAPCLEHKHRLSADTLS